MPETKQAPIYWSAFCWYMADSRRSIPSRVWVEFRRQGLARYIERVQSGVARSELTFNDLVNRCEDAMFGGRASLTEAR